MVMEKLFVSAGSDTVLKPIAGATAKVSSVVKEMMKEGFRAEEPKLYSRRQKQQRMEEKAKRDGVSTHEAVKNAAPLSDETAITIVKKKESEWQKQVRLMVEHHPIPISISIPVSISNSISVTNSCCRRNAFKAHRYTRRLRKLCRTRVLVLRRHRRIRRLQR